MATLCSSDRACCGFAGLEEDVSLHDAPCQCLWLDEVFHGCEAKKELVFDKRTWTNPNANIITDAPRRVLSLILGLRHSLR